MPLPDNKPKAAPLTPEEKLDKILKKFGDANKTADNNPGEDLRKILDDSPDLKKHILESVDKGFLANFKALPPNSGMGGSYDSGTKAINLPMNVLKRANTARSYDRVQRIRTNLCPRLTHLQNHQRSTLYNQSIQYRDKMLNKIYLARRSTSFETLITTTRNQQSQQYARQALIRNIMPTISLRSIVATRLNRRYYVTVCFCKSVTS